MASTTTTTDPFVRRRWTSSSRGYSLAEVLIALSLCLMLSGAIMGGMLFMMRSSIAVGNYADMNMESRRGLEILGRDLRGAAEVAPDFTETSFQIVTFRPNGTWETVSYSFHPDDPGQPLVRTMGTEERNLITNIGELSFRYYDLQGQEVANPLAIKQVQVRLTTRQTAGGIDQTEKVISARFILRNRAVSN